LGFKIAFFPGDETTACQFSHWRAVGGSSPKTCFISAEFSPVANSLDGALCRLIFAR
jgi:hypothetical protein